MSNYSIEFNTKKNGLIILKESDIWVDNFIVPFSYNPHGTKFFIIGHEVGAICGLFANHEQDALDSMVNHNYEQFIVDNADYEKMTNEEKDNLSYLGNASEPCNLDYCWIVSYDFDLTKKSDFEIIAS